MFHAWVNSNQHPWYGYEGAFSVDEAYSKDQSKISEWAAQFTSWPNLTVHQEVLSESCGYQETL